VTIEETRRAFAAERERTRYSGLVCERIARNNYEAERARRLWESVWADAAWIAMMEAQS
jgi:hypothetical protein